MVPRNPIVRQRTRWTLPFTVEAFTLLARGGLVRELASDSG
jgi:hypothetical protein